MDRGTLHTLLGTEPNLRKKRTFEDLKKKKTGYEGGTFQGVKVKY